jgi:phosphoribosylamine--glycine ligase/phosphoribosylaminoimidazole synthetase
MYIIVIGSGARECAIIRRLLKETSSHILCLGTNQNPQLVNKCKFIDYINVTDLSIKLLDITKAYKIEFVIIGPEAPLESGIADMLFKLSVPCFGPLFYYSQLETSKIFCRNFLKENGLNLFNPKFVVGPFNNENSRNAVINSDFEWVIKKNNLCGGKGVTVEGCDFNKEDRSKKIYETEKTLTSVNNSYLIEEKLYGKEFSLMTVSDGANNCVHFPPIQDYKRLEAGNKGPNTGSMGCLIDANNTLPFLTEQDLSIASDLNKTVINIMYSKREDTNLSIGYCGVLYGSFIKTNMGQIKLIEYNCRFGDPEGVIALELLQNSFYDMCKQATSNALVDNYIFNKDAFVAIYMVPKDYPRQKKNSQYDVYISDYDKLYDNIYFANMEKYIDHNYSLTSRTMVVIQRGKTLMEARKKAYNIIPNIHGRLKYRSDIGDEYLSEYEQAGVSISQGDTAIELIKPWVKITQHNSDIVSSEYGSFGGEYKFNGITLVSSIDGVGTKSILASEWFGDEAYVNLGADIVGHSINDILVQGAFPLFFLDYYGCSSLNNEALVNFVKGAAIECKRYNVVLLGGETAEMPAVYVEGVTDLVGCIIGYKAFDMCGPMVGDVLVGIPSNSPHTNGYSLIRKVTQDKNVPDVIKEALCAPHIPYINEIITFLKEFTHEEIHGMAHITGGGLIGNLKRVTKDLQINITFPQMPVWAQYLHEECGVSKEEMEKVFNCGIGYVLIVSKETYEKMMENVRYSYYFKVGELS